MTCDLKFTIIRVNHGSHCIERLSARRDHRHFYHRLRLDHCNHHVWSHDEAEDTIMPAAGASYPAYNREVPVAALCRRRTDPRCFFLHFPCGNAAGFRDLNAVQGNERPCDRKGRDPRVD